MKSHREKKEEKAWNKKMTVTQVEEKRQRNYPISFHTAAKKRPEVAGKSVQQEPGEENVGVEI